MPYTLFETLSWGIYMTSSGYIASKILGFDRKSVRNIIYGTFILGCIRGYTGKNIIILLIENVY